MFSISLRHYSVILSSFYKIKISENCIFVCFIEEQINLNESCEDKRFFIVLHKFIHYVRLVLNQEKLHLRNICIDIKKNLPLPPKIECFISVSRLGCMCLYIALVWRNHWADIDETLQKWSPIGLVVRVCISAH